MRALYQPRHIAQVEGFAYVVMMSSLLTLMALAGCRKPDEMQSSSRSALDPNVFNDSFAHLEADSTSLHIGDFSDVQKTNTILQLLVGSHYRGVVACTDPSWILDSRNDWLRGTGTSEAVLREVCRNPAFTFSGDDCTVVFNVIRATGEVDEWTVVFTTDPESNAVRVLSVETVNKMPADTFSWHLMG